jgi:glycosyltransferase 2 family protein
MITRLVKIIIPTVLILFLLYQIFQNYTQIIDYWSHIQFLPFIVAVILLFFVYPEASFTWKKLLEKMDENRPISKVFKVWMISSASRYIPGFVWQYLGRVELAKKDLKIDRKITIISLVYEALLVLLAGGTVSLLALPYIQSLKGNIVLIILLIPIIILVMQPIIFNRLLLIIAKILHRQIDLKLLTLSFLDLLSVLPWYIGNFILNGLAFYFLTLAVNPDISIDFLFISIGFYAFSWTVGYISIFAPCGIGVTEISLTLLLSQYLPLPLASSLAIVYRCILTLTEVIMIAFSIQRENVKS